MSQRNERQIFVKEEVRSLWFLRGGGGQMGMSRLVGVARQELGGSEGRQIGFGGHWR